jgi:hypothetical protein
VPVDNNRVLTWLLTGDPAIRWQVRRDLLGETPAAADRERAGVARRGWGRRLLAAQTDDGRWGGGLYTPKWTSTTYTMLLLRALGLARGNRKARAGTLLLLNEGLNHDGGINLWRRWSKDSETCVTGMVLGIASRFVPEDSRVDRLASHLLEQQMDDGGWNCQRPRGATHSSLHTTISVLEALLEYEQAKGRMGDLTCRARRRAEEFLCRHRMFRSHRTGKIIKEQMTRFFFPPQWHYDVLRGLDYLQAAGAGPEARLEEAVELVERRRDADGFWRLPVLYRGKYHFVMEQPGEPSRWNTLRALRVLKWWRGEPR